MRYIYEDGDGYAIVEGENPEEALRRIWHRDLDSEDHEMMRVSPFALTEITMGQVHRLEFELKTPPVELNIIRSTPVGTPI